MLRGGLAGSCLRSKKKTFRKSSRYGIPYGYGYETLKHPAADSARAAVPYCTGTRTSFPLVDREASPGGAQPWASHAGPRAGLLTTKS